MNYKVIEDLVLSARKGDNRSKEKLIEEFRPFILKFSQRIFIDGYELYDIQNECYSILLNSINTYNPDRHRFVAYATISIKNSIYLLLRKSKRRSSTDGIEALTLDGNLEEFNISNTVDITERLCKLCESEELKSAINILTPKEKELLDFVILKNRTVKEYSKVNNIKYSAAVYKKNILIKKLYNYMSEFNNVPIYTN